MIDVFITHLCEWKGPKYLEYEIKCYKYITHLRELHFITYSV